MNDPATIVNELSNKIWGHKPECVCVRCKHGQETFLLPSDISEIQRDAREGMVPVEAIKPLVAAVSAGRSGIRELKELRASYPNLFAKEESQ